MLRNPVEHETQLVVHNCNDFGGRIRRAGRSDLQMGQALPSPYPRPAIDLFVRKSLPQSKYSLGSCDMQSVPGSRTDRSRCRAGS